MHALADAAGGAIGVRKSYTAVGWHAQISKLTSSPRGYQAAERAGLSVNHRTLVDWLAERREPNAENRGKIERAYRGMAGRWPAEVEGREFRITGDVSIGTDTRTRGADGHAALSIDGSAAGPSGWSRMKDQWEAGEVDADDFEEWFVEDILEADLGEFSIPPEFGGSSYSVEIL